MTTPPAPAGRLVVAPTPIGNLADVTLRVLEALAAADLVACEDTRRTRRLLERHGIEARLVSYHEHNEAERIRELVPRLVAGDTVALVSDSGTPLVSDPGFQLVRAAIAGGVPVEVLPGPSAPVTALVASGLPAERWCFVGFLPRSRGERQQVLMQAQSTLVAFESPRRLAGTLALLAERDPGRAVAVCRELTKRHEEIRRGSARELADHYRDRNVRGEVVLVCEAAAAGAHDADRALTALEDLIAAGARPRAAAAAVAALAGVAANDLYRSLTGPDRRQ